MSMDDQALERLLNLINNPYTWGLFVFVMALPYILKYMRRWYPKSWQESMAKEEACTLEYQQKPEMKFIRRILSIGLVSVVLISYVLAYYILPNIEYHLKTFRDLFLIGAVIIVILTIYFESKIKKNKNCNDVIVGYKYLKFPNVILTTIVSSFIIVGIFYFIGIIFPLK